MFARQKHRPKANSMKYSSLKLMPILLIADLFVLSDGFRLVAQTAPPLLELAGQGPTGPGGYNLTVSAQVTTNGTTGFANLAGGAAGPVIQVVPPSNDSCGCWCINVRRTDVLPLGPDYRVNCYIRDIGDGITNFDQISFISSIGGDCTTFSTGGLFFIPLVQGDFRAIVADSDGDGVPDYRDECPDTAHGSAVNEEGCSIDQLVPCAGPATGGTWRNHGDYLRAVTAAADAFLATGFITAEQRDAALRAARHSDCGKK